MKHKKKLWIAAALVSAAALIAGGLFLARRNREPVYVFGFAEGIPGMADYYHSSGESGGMVTTDKIQPAYLTKTQTVLEILVEEGQQVKQGDILFTYDTTLSDIQLMQKDLSVQQARLDLETARRELAVINCYVPIRYYEVEEPEPEEPVADLSEFDLTGRDYLAYSGSGTTSLTPKYCWLRSSAMIDRIMLDALFAGTEEDVLFLRLQHTENDANDGAVTQEYGLKVMRLHAGTPENSEITYRFSFFDPNARNTGAVDDGVEWNSGYTAAQIAAMRTEKQQQIKEMEFQIRVAEAELRIMQKEADSGEVRAEFDGKVVDLLDPETAVSTGDPLLRLSGGGGFYVTGAVSELELQKIRPGQTVLVRSYENWQEYEGTILEIGEFPQEDQQNYGSGNQNVSYYPYTVFIDESADLQDGHYVSMSLQAAADQGSLYVDNAFLRTEGALSYVYVRGEDGLLEKRTVQVGSSLWGTYTEIRSGITGEDYLAFPYGKAVNPGAPTLEGTWENLYS